MAKPNRTKATRARVDDSGTIAPGPRPRYIWLIMEQIVLQLKNTRKRRLLLELLGELDFVQVTSVIRDGRKVAFANELMEALVEAKADERGEKKLQRARDFLKHG